VRRTHALAARITVSLAASGIAAAAPWARAAPPSPTAGQDAPADAAASGPISVATFGCGALRGDEVARLLDLELRTVTDEIREGPPLLVQLRCEPSALVISVVDPLTRKRIERDIPPLGDAAGGERIAALAVSQLFSASWLELLLPAPDPQPQPLDPPPPPSAVRAAKRAAAERAAPPRSYELMLGAGVRGRSLESGAPFAAARLDGLFRAWLTPSVALVAVAGWDYGQAVRSLGQLRAQAFGAAGGLGWRFAPEQGVGVGGHMLAGAAYARVAGRPSQSDDVGGATSGGTAELLASVGPRVAGSRIRLDFDFEVGGMLRSPVADVQTREADGSLGFDVPVTLGGLWIGAMLRLGAVLPRDR